MGINLVALATGYLLCMSDHWIGVAPTLGVLVGLNLLLLWAHWREAPPPHPILRVLPEIPRSRTDPSAPRLVTDSTPVPTHRPPLRILIVEDNQINQLVLRQMLEKLGHFIEGASNGAEAVSILAEQTFDLVLMDLQMPEMDGHRATRLIRQREKAVGGRVPIIAVTANSQPGERERCLASGMDEFITKPVAQADLLECIDRVLPHQHPACTCPALSRPAWWPAIDEMGLDQESIGRLIQTFLDTIPPRLAVLRQGVELRDADQVASAAHAIKGSLSVFGPSESVRLAEQLEILGLENRMDQAPPCLAALGQQMHLLLESMRQALEDLPKWMETKSGSC
ncbi:MAG: response regulator [Gemmataceae bacterium]